MRESGTHDESIGVVIDQRVVEVEDGEAVHDFLNAPQPTTNARLVIEKNTRRRRRCRSTPKNSQKILLKFRNIFELRTCECSAASVGGGRWVVRRRRI